MLVSIFVTWFFSYLLLHTFVSSALGHTHITLYHFYSLFESPSINMTHPKDVITYFVNLFHHFFKSLPILFIVSEHSKSNQSGKIEPLRPSGHAFLLSRAWARDGQSQYKVIHRRWGGFLRKNFAIVRFRFPTSCGMGQRIQLQRHCCYCEWSVGFVH